MAPIIEVSDSDLETFNQLGVKYKLRNDLKNVQIAEDNRNNWIAIPYEFVSEQNRISGKSRMIVDPARIAYSSAVEEAGKILGINYQNTSMDSLNRYFVGDNNWTDSLKLNLALGNKTPSLREFRDILNFFNQGANGKVDAYDISGKKVDGKIIGNYFMDIIAVRVPWRSELIDADFKVKEGKLYINSNYVLDSNGNLVAQNSEVLAEDTLMEDKTPGISGISLEDWISNSTKQGLPTKGTTSGNLYYVFPRGDNNLSAWFGASSFGIGLSCGGGPSDSDTSLGGRAVRHE